MTDSKTAIERLREMLDARGVEWWEGWNKSQTVFDGANDVRYMADCMLGQLYIRSVLPITPEQAIAATLGSGRLTAKQVEDVVEKHWHDLPDEYDMPEAIALPEYSYDWHAIANELNATLGSGECEFELNADMTAIRCDKCGYELPAGTNLDTTRYCGGCGKAVKR